MEKRYSIFSHFKYIFKNFYQYDRGIFLDVFIYLVSSIILSLSGVFIPYAITRTLENRVKTLQFLIICLSLFTISGIFHYLYKYFIGKIDIRVNTKKTDIFGYALLSKVISIDYELFESSKTKKLANEAGRALYSGNWSGIGGFFIYVVFLIENIAGLIIFTILIGTLDFKLIYLLFGLSFIHFLFFRRARLFEDREAKKQSKLGLMIHYLNRQAFDTKSGKDVRMYQLSPWLMGILKKYNKAYQKSEERVKEKYFTSDFVGLSLEIVRDFVCYAYIISLFKNGMPISTLILYINMVRGFENWVSVISDSAFHLFEESSTIDRYRNFISYDTNHHYTINDIEKLNKSWYIELKDVCFSYDQGKSFIINHLNLSIKENEKIAIVGLNGAGKTTLVKLLCGLYHPTSGQILINGIDIETIDRDTLFHYISVIFQDTQLISFTIQENITFQNNEKIDKKRFYDSLNQSDFMNKVQSLPMQEKQYLYKDMDVNGISLSGGEVQKLLCARALYKPSHLMILDEPTAALDAIAERNLYVKYSDMVKGKVAIFISHRLASTKFCDRILYFEEGNIAEMGTHDELMKKQGKYAHLFEVQSQYYKNGGEPNENDK